MKNWAISLLSALLFLASCQKDEIPVAPHTPGEVEAKMVEMGGLYKDQIWYDLETATEVSRNYKTMWDLGFETTSEGWHIVLNSANRMQVALTSDDNLASITDTTGLNFTWDTHTGNMDSTGIGNWKNTSNIYVLDRGKDEEGKPLGLAKVIFDSANASTYFFRYADFNGTEWQSTTISKDSNYVYSYFSFKNSGEQVWVAPPKQDWDICFTQYTYIYYYMNPMVAYLVTGVIINPTQPFSVQIFDMQFEDITYDHMSQYENDPRIDNIGWDWKQYDFDAGYYVTNPSKNYIVKTQSHKMYKIHFMDWYNQDGEKGSPTFEFSEL